MMKRFAGWFAGIVGISVVGVALFSVWMSRTDGDDSTLESIVNPQRTASELGSAAASEFPNRSTDSSDREAATFSDLSYHCPSITDRKLTDDCLQALDNRFGGELTTDAPLVPVCDQPTWSQVFNDPAGKRDMVIEALSRAECRPQPDQIRDVPTCARNAIAELGVLHYKCAEANDYRVGATYWGSTLSELLDDVETGDIGEYRRQRRYIEAEYFRERWFAARCGLVDEKVLSTIDELSELYTLRGAWWGGGGVGPKLIEHYAIEGSIWRDGQQNRVKNQGMALHNVAARLGHLWVLSQYGAFHMDDLFLLNPAQALIYEGMVRAYRVDDDSCRAELRIHWLWQDMEEVSPGIGKRFRSSPVGNYNVFWEFNDRLDEWWESQEPRVSELYREFRDEETESQKNCRRRVESIRRAHVRAAVMFMQQKDIQYNEQAIPKWAADMSEEQLAEAQKVLNWLAEAHPDSRHAPNPAAPETCRPQMDEVDPYSHSNESAPEEEENGSRHDRRLR